MQAELAVVPEFDADGANAEPGPVGRARNIADRIFGGIFGDGLLQRETAFQRPRLLRRPGADAASAWTRRVIGVRFRIGDDLHLPAQAHLPTQAFPVETHGRFFLAEDFASLLAFEIRIENEAAIIDVLQQHHTHIRQAVFVHGCECDRVRIVDFGGRCILQPFGKKRERFIFFSEVTGC